MAGSGRLLERVREAIRVRHYSRRTEARLRRLDPAACPVPRPALAWRAGGRRGRTFLSDLATRRKVAASTQNQALAALLFPYRHVLDVELPWTDELVRTRRPARVPVVLDRGEVAALLSRIHGVPGLMARLLYGSGLRLPEFDACA